ncbi:hypothetical protein MIND_00736600 [Mycena indigotica]|uniref:Uncharacterized protein n=1 Tax=Mycena indigotica TaxID=2126181 RepID=A0A8H6SMR5_9AGAR|nr:uncharacterized protein MIND_00736600 [Mycena indigotica]KAF7301710.1 hypothetical protein MIND_00736600 [Mycena indigotica]
MAIAGLDESTSVFNIHPDYRQVATFALGWVFVASLNNIVSSVLVQRLFGFIRGRSTAAPDPERSYVSEKLSLRSLDIENNPDIRHGYSNTAFFALPLCFLFASVAQFGSLLAFPNNADAACAFVVAWGGMAAQSGRLVGALIVIFELRRMGIAKWEFWVAIVWLIIGIGFIFLNNAISVGVLTQFQPLGVSYCDRKHFLPASLVSSILYFSLEVYAIARMILFLSSNAHMRKVIQDVRVLRPLALVLLELLTLVPGAVFTNIVAEFVPFSIGAVAVLMAFNVRPSPSAIQQSPRESTLSYATYPSVQSIRQSIPFSVTPSQARSTIQPPSPAMPAPARRHPFAASAYMDPSFETREEWIPPTARTTRTIDSVAAESINNAVVQVGQRARAASRADETIGKGKGKQLDSRIVPSQIEFAERLDLETAQANSLPSRPRPTVNTPPLDSAFNDDDISELISPASRMQPTNFRLSRVVDGPSRQPLSRHTSYRTSFIPDESEPSSPDSRMPVPLHDAQSISSSERRRSASLSIMPESSNDHRRTMSNEPSPMPERWPTFNQSQFRAAGFGVSRQSSSSSSSPSSGRRAPPPLPIKTLPLPGAGIRAAQGPKGPRPPPSAQAQSPRFNLPQ